MRIFYLITKSEPGGAQTHIYQLSKHLAARGHQIAVMSYPDGWLANQADQLEIPFYGNKFLSNSLNIFKDVKAGKILKKAIDDFKPDLVSCHSSKAGIIGRLIIKNKIPTIFTAHGWAFTTGTPLWRKVLAVIAEKVAASYCEKIICVSRNDKQLAVKYRIIAPEKLLVIHNGVEINGSSEMSGSKFLSGKVGIVFMGRLARPKDQLLFLEAFNGLSEEIKNKTEVVIIGDGPKKKKLEYFIKDNYLSKYVYLSGSLPRRKVFSTLQNSHIFVLISDWEGFPRSVLEAMSCSLPVIASDVGGVGEAVDGRNGFLIGRKNRKEIKEALKKLIKNPSLAIKMGRFSRERAEKEFSLEKMLKKTSNLYYEILSSKSKSL